MRRYLTGRLAQALVTFLVLSFLIFGINRLTGDPVNALLPPNVSFEAKDRLRHELGLDRPFLVQYADFMGGLLRGDLGESLSSQRDVSEMILSRLPASLELAAASIFLTLAIGIPLGVYAAWRRGGVFDSSARLFAVIGQSAPAFWVGLLLVLLVAIRLDWLPTGGRGSPLHVILPALTMAWATMAGVTRLMRSSVLETLELDYVRFCRARGIPERKVLWKHTFRNASLPVLTFGGVLVANALTGSVVTESIFVWPGIGRLLIDGIVGRDFPVVQGVVLFFAAGYVVMALVVDVLYLMLNPRLRMSEGDTRRSSL